MKNDNTPVDIDFAEAAVPHYARRGIVTMFMIMLGFTFFSASMWVGKELADGLDFGGFIISMIIGGLILSLYTGLLGYVGAETGMSLDLLARKAFGAKRLVPAERDDLVYADRLVRRRYRHVCHSGCKRAARRQHSG